MKRCHTCGQIIPEAIDSAAWAKMLRDLAGHTEYEELRNDLIQRADRLDPPMPNEAVVVVTDSLPHADPMPNCPADASCSKGGTLHKHGATLVEQDGRVHRKTPLPVGIEASLDPEPAAATEVVPSVLEAARALVNRWERSVLRPHWPETLDLIAAVKAASRLTTDKYGALSPSDAAEMDIHKAMTSEPRQ